MTKGTEPCCSSRATLCYWFIVSLLTWGLLSLIGIYWHPLRATVGCTPFRDGYRLPRQLDQESFSSLRYHWPALSSRWSGIPFFWCRFDPLQRLLGLASHRGRHRYCLSAGMAAYEAFSVLARSQSSWRQVNEWKITFINLRVRIFRGARFALRVSPRHVCFSRIPTASGRPQPAIRQSAYVTYRKPLSAA